MVAIGPSQKCEVPDDQPISRRFGLQQKRGKIRLVDDYTESGVNTCVTSVESPVLHTIDVACAVLALWFGLCGERGLDPELVARTFDLTSAYRQVALSSEGKQFACIRVYDPEGKGMQYFRSRVLPFGAVKSVHAFRRLARAIWWIGAVGCRLLWTSFYDDFISFSKPAVMKCIENTIVSLFKLLGWSFVEEGDKCLPYDSVCEALGVSFDLRGSGSDSPGVQHRIQGVWTLGRHSRGAWGWDTWRQIGAEAQRMHAACRVPIIWEDRPTWHESAECVCRRAQTKAWSKRSLLSQFVQAAGAKQHTQRNACARCWQCSHAGNERDDECWSCGLGGFLVNKGQIQYFSLPVDKQGRHVLGENLEQQIIFEAETLAAVLAFMLWKDCFENQRCLLFVDNEGTKFSLLKGSSEDSAVDLIAVYFAECESHTHSFTWLARVPSKGNIAEPPSGNGASAAFFQRATDVSAKAKSLLDGLLTRLDEDGETGLVTPQVSKKKKQRWCCLLVRVCTLMWLSHETTLYLCKCMAMTCIFPESGRAGGLFAFCFCARTLMCNEM